MAFTEPAGGTTPWGGLYGLLLIVPPDDEDEGGEGTPEVGADLCIHDHRGQALDRLVEQFRNKPGITAYISALVAPIQRLEDALCQLLHQRSLAAGGEERTAVGAQLDVIGKIVGFRAPRDADDNVYDRLIRAMISANKSSGLIEDYILVTRLVTGIDTGIEVERQNISTLVIRPTADITPPEDADFLMRFLHRAARGGVRIILEFYPAPQNETFRFGSGPGFGTGRLAGARSNAMTNQPVGE